MEKQEAINYLKGLFSDDTKNGKHPKLYTIVKHVSRSGMSRHIDVFYMKDNTPIKLNFYIDCVGLFKRAKDYRALNADSLRVGGCGMDMGFHVVYTLSSFLYGHGKESGFNCLGENCRSNDHTNGDRNRKPHKHSDGGYLLEQEWL